MVHVTAQARRHEVARARILDAAERIVVAEGVGALSMQGLADATGRAVGGLYRYVAGKDAVLAGLQARALDALRAHLVDAVQRAPEGPLERLRALAAAWDGFAAADPVRFQLLADAVASPRPVLDDPHRHDVATRREAALAVVVAALEGAAQAGLLRPGDARVRATALFAGAVGARQVGRFAAQAGASAGAVRDVLVEGLLEGWSARSAPQSDAQELT
jgi:AcrR family transcriptional regulator